MTLRDLISYLSKKCNGENDGAEVTCSVDMSTCDEDAGDRVYGFGICEVIDDGEITLVFEQGEANFSFRKGSK